jgi:hypothetical protein
MCSSFSNFSWIILSGSPSNYLKKSSKSFKNIETKVMIFRKRKSAQDPKFILHGQTLDIVDTYSYLGIIFKYNGTFFETRKKLVEQANKALYCIYKLVRNESIPIDLQLKMFDSMIEPILLYGSEVWGYENLKVIEQIQLKFCKRILKVRNTTPHIPRYEYVATITSV